MTHKRTIYAAMLTVVLAGSVYANVVTEWNAIAVDTIKTAQYTSVTASRALAMVHVAMYDAVHCRRQPVFCEAAAASSAHRVLKGLFASQAATLDAALAASLAGIPDGRQKVSGIRYAQIRGDAILARRTNDGSMTMVPYTPGTDPGMWQPTPPMYASAMMPQWATVTPFAMTSPSQFRPVPPLPLDSAQYAADFNTVYTLGGQASTARTMDQMEIAMFWMDMPGTITTVGRWNAIARDIAVQRNLNIAECTELFAIFNVALADAGIAAWDAKYTYSFWRPITAIYDANSDNNPLTNADPLWEPLITTPAFPEYVSAHRTFSAAAAEVLARFFNDATDFTVASYTMPTTYRSYTSFSQAAEEAGMSRIYGGIHFPAADINGRTLGRSIAAYVWSEKSRHTRRWYSK